MYKKVMIPLDGSELAERALPHVKAFIKGFNISDVFLVRVKAPVKPDFRTYDKIFNEEIIGQAQKIWRDIEKQEIAAANNYLSQVSEKLKQRGTAVHTEVLVGDAAKKLADYAESAGVDLIVMTTHGRSGIRRWIIGSVAEKLVRAASVPVFMVRAAHSRGRV